MNPKQFSESFTTAKVELEEAYKHGAPVTDMEVYFYLQMKFMTVINEKLESVKHDLIKEQKGEFQVLRGQLKQSFDTLNDYLKSKE